MDSSQLTKVNSISEDMANLGMNESSEDLTGLIVDKVVINPYRIVPK